MKPTSLLSWILIALWTVACLPEPGSEGSSEVDTAAEDTEGAAETTALPDTAAETAEVVDRSDEVFDPERLLEITIEMDPGDWDALRTQSRSFFDILGPGCLDGPRTRPFTWFQADVTIDGERIEDVAVRKKGFLGSLDEVKPSLKLKFSEFVDDRRYSSMKRLTLNNNKQDPSHINACLGYAFMRDLGLPAPRCNFAHVTVNGQDLGVFSNVESIKSDFLERNFGSAAGNLYEGTLSDFREGWQHTFERKNNDALTERPEIPAMVAALEASDADLLSALEPLLDLDAYLTFWAAEVIVAHWDGYAGNTNNYYIYLDPSDDRFRFIPWGADALFRSNRDLLGGAPVPASVMAQGLLPRRLYQLPETRDRYLARLTELLEQSWDPDALLAEVDRMEALIAPHVRNGDWADALSARRAFIGARRDAILSEIQAGPATWDLPLRDIPCMEPLGATSGSFSTTWGSMSNPNPFFAGFGEMNLTYEGLQSTFKQVGAQAGLGENDQAGRAQLTFFGLREDDTIDVVVVFTDLDQLVPDRAIAVDFATAEGYLLYLNPAVSQEPQLRGLIAEGFIDFDEVGTTDGAPISGRYSAEVFRAPF